MTRWLPIAVLALAFAFPAEAAEPVSVDTFPRAETHFYMKQRVDQGCFGVVCHNRTAPGVDQQDVVRMNRDTLYSAGTFDLATPLTVTLPDPKGRFQSLQIINEGHFTPDAVYGPASVTLTKESVGSRYVFLIFRTFLDPNDPNDIAAAHALQDGIAVSQQHKGTFEIPDWDQQQLGALRDRLKALSSFAKGEAGRFGTKEQVDPIRHLIASAAGWGGNPLSAAAYSFGQVEANDGKQPFTLTLKDVPVDGFWSVTVYNAEGFFEAPASAASVNSVTAKREADGSAVIRFGGDPAAQNYLRIMPGWNYIVRLYRPRAPIIDGTWTPPDPAPVN
jgi:hypothetical protein